MDKASLGCSVKEEASEGKKVVWKDYHRRFCSSGFTAQVDRKDSASFVLRHSRMTALHKWVSRVFGLAVGLGIAMYES